MIRPESQPSPLRAVAVAPDVSVVIPALNERPTLRSLFERLRDTLQQSGRTFEVVFVDDGSDDGTRETLGRLSKEDHRCRPVCLARNYGKSAALMAGFSRARGATIVTMDADLQDLPEELPKLLQSLDDGLDFAQAWRVRRQDPWHKVMPSSIFNALCSAFSGLQLHDVNCGLKAFRRPVLDCLRLDDDMHRFIPVLAHRGGFRVGELEVEHERRQFGRSKYGTRRFLRGAADLCTVVLFPRLFASSYHVAVPLGGLLLLVSLGLTIATFGWLAAGHRGLLLEGGLAALGTLALGLTFLVMGYLNRVGFTAEQVHGSRRIEVLDDPEVGQ